jgi:hypothetical protein
MTDRWRRSLRQLDTEEPSPDLWERAVVRSGEAPLPDITSNRQHRIVAGAVAALVATAGVTVAFLAFRSLGTEPTGSDLVTYRDPTGAWEIRFPDRFQQGSIPPLSPPHPRVTVDGIWIANFEPPPPPDDAGGPLYFEVPDDGVIVFIYQMSGGPHFVPRGPDSRFPISFDDLGNFPGDFYPGVRQGVTVLANGEPYTISVVIGPEASENDRTAATDVLPSFRILPLEEGTATGRNWTFYVLGPPERYPVGSVTRFDESRLPQAETADPFPFYLVRVPEGFYALAWPADLVGGYQDCDVTYDSASREFSCPNGARWALDGSVIAKPDPELPGDPLRVLLVRISLDGHVLVSPNVFMSETELDLKLT